MKKFMSVLLVCLFACGMMEPASAAAIEVAYDEDSQMILVEDDSAITRAAVIPTEWHALPYKAETEGLEENTQTLTKYYFSPSGASFKVTGTVTPSGNENNKSRYAQLRLYEVGSNTLIDTYTIPQFASQTDFSCTFSNLSSTKNYYFAFRNTTSGWAWDNFWITATFTIN